MRYLRQIVVLVAGASVSLAGAMAQECAVKLVRPDVTGLKTQHEVTLEKTVSRTRCVVGTSVPLVDGQVPAQKLVVTAKYTRQVTEAGNSDNPVRLLITFDKLTIAQEGAKPKDILASGTQVRASAFRGEALKFDPVSQETAIEGYGEALIGMVVQTPDPADDECYGSKAKRQPGDEWMVNDGALKKVLLGGPGAQNEPDTLKGSVRFTRIDKLDKADCAVLSVTVTADYKPGTGKQAANVKDMGSKLTESQVFYVPLDAASPIRERTKDSTTVHLTHTLAPGETLETELKTQTKRQEKVQLLK